MTLTWASHAASLFEPRKAPLWATPGEMAKALDSRTIQTPTMQLFDEALLWAFNTPDARLLISCPPQAGKASGYLDASQHGY